MIKPVEFSALTKNRLYNGSRLPRQIGVFRALQLGDLLCAVPAFRALRKAFPESRLLLIGLPWARVFVQRYSRYFDEFIEFPGYPGLPERTMALERLGPFLADLQEMRLDAVIQMHGCGLITNPLTQLFGAKVSAGFYLPGQFCPDPERYIAYPSTEPEVWRHLRLMQSLGIPLQGEFLEFEVQREDVSRFRAIEGAHQLRPGNYVCLHPGARAEFRRWSPEYFAAVADWFLEQGFKVVLTGSTDEMELGERVRSLMSGTALNFAGKTDLGSLAALLAGARLLVCNDTGVSHLAAALRVPSVIVFPKSDLAGWPPLDRQLHRSVCRITGVMPEDVMAHAESLMRHWSADLAA